MGRSEKDEASARASTVLFSPQRQLLREAHAQYALPHYLALAADDDGDDVVVSDSAVWRVDTPRDPCLVLLFNDMLVVARALDDDLGELQPINSSGTVGALPVDDDDSVRYAYFTRVVWEHHGIGKRADELFQLDVDPDDGGGDNCIVVSSVSGNVLRLFFGDAETAAVWLNAMRKAYE